MTNRQIRYRLPMYYLRSGFVINLSSVLLKIINFLNTDLICTLHGSGLFSLFHVLVSVVHVQFDFFFLLFSFRFVYFCHRLIGLFTVTPNYHAIHCHIHHSNSINMYSLWIFDIKSMELKPTACMWGFSLIDIKSTAFPNWNIYNYRFLHNVPCIFPGKSIGRCANHQTFFSWKISVKKQTIYNYWQSKRLLNLKNSSFIQKFQFVAALLISN